nr:MAG TPA: hypothetical protein [Caudoviricetes sp.]
MSTQAKSEASGRGVVKMQIISRSLGEIYAYIPQWGEYYSSINKTADGRTVRSRKPAYVWEQYIEGICRRALKVCGQVEAGELPTGRMELCGNVCTWDTSRSKYATDIDCRGRRGQYEYRNIMEAVGSLIQGSNAAMEARLLSYEERRKNE